MNNEEEIYTVRELDFPEVNLQLKSNDIVYVFFKDNCVLDIELQMQLLNHYTEITGGKLMHFVFMAGDSVIITKEARDNAIVIEDISMVGASAIIVNNLAYKIIANFYMKVNKPKRPLKAFENLADAVKWLKTIKL